MNVETGEFSLSHYQQHQGYSINAFILKHNYCGAFRVMKVMIRYQQQFQNELTTENGRKDNYI